MAAAIVREDIRSTVYELDSYPSPNQYMYNAITDVPESSTSFLSEVCGKK